MRKLHLTALLLSALSLFGIMSCKKNNNNDVSPNAITLDALKVSGNLVTLSWSKLANDSLSDYIIAKVVDSTIPQYITNIHVDKSKTSYVDTLPMTPYVRYYVVAQLPTRVIKSNTQTSVRTDVTFIKMSPKDAVYDRGTRKLYIYSADGNMALYDVANKTISKQITMDATVGYCALGNYSGTTELYVPRTDGWLFIYNAATLEQIDQINIGSQLYSVTVNDEKLYVTKYDYSEGIVCYSRATKSKLSSTNASDIKRLRLVPGTNSEFFGAGDYSSASYFKFSNTGSFISQQSKYLSSYYMYSDIFEIFPDGSKFITGGSGIIVDKDLTYVSTLPHGSTTFTSFDFDNTNNLVYASCNSKTIQAYAMSNYQLTRTVNTLGYPKKIFYDNGTLLSVSLSGYDPYSYYNYSTYCFVEQF
jgi:hypothetical protein